MGVKRVKERTGCEKAGGCTRLVYQRGVNIKCKHLELSKLCRIFRPYFSHGICSIKSIELFLSCNKYITMQKLENRNHNGRVDVLCTFALLDCHVIIRA